MEERKFYQLRFEKGVDPYEYIDAISSMGDYLQYLSNHYLVSRKSLGVIKKKLNTVGSSYKIFIVQPDGFLLSMVEPDALETRTEERRKKESMQKAQEIFDSLIDGVYDDMREQIKLKHSK